MGLGSPGRVRVLDAARKLERLRLEDGAYLQSSPVLPCIRKSLKFGQVESPDKKVRFAVLSVCCGRCMRHRTWVASIAALLGLTESSVDQLFHAPSTPSHASK